ncbi:hypothetical protein TNCV_4551381 [Trichonephila clavipes]|nr:hypothetical protein TNCV_4551381 [Trichonephila clavipes]
MSTLHKHPSSDSKIRANKDTLSKEKDSKNENEETDLDRSNFAHYEGTPIDTDLRERILKLSPCHQEDNFQKDAKERAFHHFIIVSYAGQDKRSNGNGCAIQHEFMLLTVRYVGFSLIEQIRILKKHRIKV